MFTDSEGCGLSHRNITVSTSGLVPAMEELMAKTNIRLAVSLNASTDQQRNLLMPVNRKWPIEELLRRAPESGKGFKVSEDII